MVEVDKRTTPQAAHTGGHSHDTWRNMFVYDEMEFVGVCAGILAGGTAE
jgi:hypothetical protein